MNHESREQLSAEQSLYGVEISQFFTYICSLNIRSVKYRPSPLEKQQKLCFALSKKVFCRHQNGRRVLLTYTTDCLIIEFSTMMTTNYSRYDGQKVKSDRQGSMNDVRES